jgi:outer membrane protein OmpU
MNKIRKIGLSALAGSLVAVSASAGDLSVTGTWEVTYKSDDKANLGNSFGSKSAMSFSGSGDVDGLGTATWYAAINDNNPAGYLSHKVTLDMGDMGEFGFDQGVGSYGANTIDDKSPTAWEESWHNTANSSGGFSANGGSSGVLGYKNTFMDFNLNFEYSPEIAAGDGGDGGNGARSTATTVTQTGSNTNFAITNSTLVDGLDFGAGYGSNDSDSTVANSSTDIESMVGYANYTMGSVTVGYTMSQSRGGSAASAANEVNAYGIAFNVNDNLSISYNEHNNDYKKTSSDGSTGSGQADVEQESKGIAIAYTMGGATLAIQQNEMDNVKGVQNTNDEITEISLSLAF